MTDETGARTGDTLVLHYRLGTPDGEILATTFGEEPFTCTLGTGELEPGLEELLVGLNAGERATFDLAPGALFGTSDPARIQRVPLGVFPEELKPEADQLIEFTLPNGEVLAGLVLEVGEEDATVDFNHPLSDCPVRFEVDVLEVRRKA